VRACPAGDARQVVTVASTDDVVIAVHDFGGSGPPMLLSHATGFHGWVLEPLARHLADRFHCWAFDHRGHGASSRPAGGDVTWDAYGTDTSAVIHGLGLGGGLGVGHSMGATALVMAELAEPGAFAGLVLYEPVLIPTSWHENGPPPPELAESARRRRQVFASREEAYENFATKPPLDVFDPDALRAYVEHGFIDTADGRVRLACDPEHEARTYEAGRLHATFERLGHITCPVLVMAGSPDGNPPAAIALEVAEAIPRARLAVLDHLGHFGPMQDPAGVAEAMRDFAARVTP
jgi:pimeloyl-ACP methyl ester carboxylesterase